jgi:molybdopterin molybdotransferase
MEENISVEEARRIVLDNVKTIDVERITLAASLDRALAEPVTSRMSIPPFDNSGVDGFAVRSADLEKTPVRLAVTEVIPAGSVPLRPIAPGACAQIMTGASIPAGADAVVPVEWTQEAEEGAVTIQRSIQAGQNVRRAGRDVQPGAIVFKGGERITPPVIGMLASLGCAEIIVRRKPKVAIITTGDELVEAGLKLVPGQIYNANGPSLAAQVQAAGGHPILSVTARDEPGSIRNAVEQALEADVLLFSGGVSVGRYDYVKQVLDEMGMRLLFWKVRQRPGKPLAFGLLNEIPVFGLPGNPVSSAVCFQQYVRPALGRMLGCGDLETKLYAAVLSVAVSKTPGLHHFVRGQASFTGEALLSVRDVGPQESNIYSSVVKANCLIHLPEQSGDCPAGSCVQIEWLKW